MGAIRYPEAIIIPVWLKSRRISTARKRMSLGILYLCTSVYSLPIIYLCALVYCSPIGYLGTT